MKKINANDAAYIHSIKSGLDVKKVEEIIASDRDYWYDASKRLGEVMSDVNWQYEYKR